MPIKNKKVNKGKEVKDNKPLGTWNMGNIALFGAILMSKGICGKDKEFLKKLMYQALKVNNQI